MTSLSNVSQNICFLTLTLITESYQIKENCEDMHIGAFKVNCQTKYKMAFLLSKIDGNEINRTSSKAVGLEMTYVKHLARKG